MQVNNPILFAAGLGSLCVALFHVIIMVLGAPAYRYFGAGERLAGLAESGSFLPTAVTSGITIVFTVFTLYAFAANGMIRQFPYLQPVLTGIGIIYSVRGLFTLYFLYLIITTGKPEFIKDLVFSLIALVIGLLYLIGVMRLTR